MDKNKLVGSRKAPVLRNREVDALINLSVRATRRGGAAGQIQGSNVRYPDRYTLEQMGREKADDIVTAQNNTDMLPDIQLAKEVLVSSIISPQDLVSTEVGFTIDDDAIPAEIVTSCRELLDDHFTKVYNISEFLPDAIGSALFDSGAYPLLVIPETALDSIINHGGQLQLENFKTTLQNGFIPNLGVLGPSSYSKLEDGRLTGSLEFTGVAFALEDILGGSTARVELGVQGALWDDNCRVTDNFDSLKLSALSRKLTEQSIQKATQAHRSTTRRYSAENHIDDELLKKVNERLSTNGGYGGGVAVAMAPVESYSRRPVGHPLVMKLPPESIIPVHVPGNPKEHVGYFLIQDADGNPMHLTKGSSAYRQMSNRLRSTTAADTNNLISDSTYRQLFGQQRPDNPMSTQAMLDSYGSIIEQDLRSRLQNGAYRAGVELSISNEIKRVMFARKASNSGTVLTFVPASQVTYFAYYYNDFGFGESLMDRTKIISTIRTVMMFANTMALVRKAVGNTELNIELDPDDDDPYSTVEQLFHEFSRTRNAAFPLAANSANDTLTYLQQAGISVAVSGNKNYPETKVSQQDRSMAGIDVDTTPEEEQRKRQWQGFGLSPELIDGLSSANFAESIVSGNLLMAKRIMVYQKATVEMLSEHLSQYILSDGTLFEDLVGAIGKTLKTLKPEAIDALYKYYELDPKDDSDAKFEHLALIRALTYNVIETYRIVLPEPDVSKFKQQVEAMTEYSQALDTALESYLTQDMLSGLVESDEPDAAAAFKTSVKAHFMRQWMRRNNVLDELDVLVDLEGNGGQDLVADIAGFNERLQKTLQGLKRAFAHNSRQYVFDKETDEKKDTELFGKDLSDEARNGSSGGGDGFGGDEDFNDGGFGGGDFSDDTATGDTDFADSTEETEDDTGLADGEIGGDTEQP